MPSAASPHPAIHMAEVGKRYRLAERSLLHALRPSRRRTARDLWAIRDIDLRIEPGETVGLLGHNGAGKSTMLRILAGVSEPTTGRVVVRGRVAPLISVGVGFHQELTGRENVYVNGMLLGLTKDEVHERFDQIVEFAELGDRIDTPVKFYSSGMFMRLGFSVAIHVDPDVLLVDEVLAVGDVAFQLKCFDRMRELSARGATIVLVSHSMHAIQLLCPRAVLINEGKIVFDGESDAAIEHHHRLLSEQGRSNPGLGADDTATGEVEVTGKVFHGEREVAHATQDDRLHLRATVRFSTDQDSPHFLFRVLSEDGLLAYQYQTTIGDEHRRFAPGEEAQVEVAFRPSFGGGGTFRLQLTVTDRHGRRVLGRTDPAPLLYVPPRSGVMGLADLEADLRVDGEGFVHRPLKLEARQGDDDPASPGGEPSQEAG